MRRITLWMRDDDLDALKAAYVTAVSAANTLKQARGTRNETQDAIYPILKQYRLRIPTEFAAGSAILTTLPRLTPLPGSTPDAVVLSGVWDAGETAAALAWTAVTDNKVINLQLRATAGPEFDPDDETIIADFAPDTAPRETLQTFGLAIPGAAASFKMYALTAEGNQKGSNEVSVERPVSA